MSTEGTRAGSSRKRIGPYRLLKRLGQGAGGSVFLADHKDLGTRFAIKVMATESERLLVEPGRAETAARLARFVREGRTLAHLSKPGHPGIVRVYDCRRNQADFPGPRRCDAGYC